LYIGRGHNAPLNMEQRSTVKLKGCMP
jgi:hypothetical protein